MTPDFPILFEPLAMQRVWGGRKFETLLGKRIPEGTIGELWEMVDRPEAQSIVQQGRLKGKTLHDLWVNHRDEIFGKLHRNHPSERFPLLIKLLDARERLSVQVHPPISRAVKLGGEPKTECWYFLDATEGAAIYAGLKKGVSKESFEAAILNNRVEETLHGVPAHTGESIFIPSGRLHAIGGGLVIVEIQQNSDTTYRVFDWNRKGLDGKPRSLHLAESLKSIDFEDFEPELTPGSMALVADCPYFHVEKHTLFAPLEIRKNDDFSIITCVTGEAECMGVKLKTGGTMLIPSLLTTALLTPMVPETSILVTNLPRIS